ncbi:uncharacterized protein [Triticum aestivum]|uniref:uncharacterized protein isoform X4 n=1 Tax=Triticum aestivum TaxID=4565 RepID=UPI0008441E0D|nr:uncharacterized protein LOC123070156 isoform X4 [Triticum aestivum]
MDEILTAEDGAHGRSLEDVNMSFSQSFSPSRPLQIFLVSDHMKGRREEWRIEGLRKELKAEVMVVSFNFLLSNSSRVLPRSEDEGKKKNLTKQLKKIKGRREEWRIKGLRKELKAEVMVASFNFSLSNSSRVLPRSEDEGKKKNLTKQLKKIKDLL